MKTPRLKVSYSILNAWAQGRYEDAIKYILRLEVVRIPAMIEGEKYHKSWESEIIRTKRLPAIFGAKQLINPQPEQYIKVDVNDWLVLSGKIDCYDKPTIYEFKTGRQNSEEIAGSMQVGVYGVLSTLNKQYVDRAEIYCFNQYLKKDNVSMSIVHITDELLEKSLNWIETIAGDIRNYIEQNKIFEKYGKQQI
jgi:hypothetical protein